MKHQSFWHVSKSQHSSIQDHAEFIMQKNGVKKHTETLLMTEPSRRKQYVFIND